MDGARLRAVAMTLVAAALWGTSFPIIKVGLTGISPAVFLFFRFLIATSLLLAIAWASGISRRVFLDRRLMLLGFIFSLSFFFQYLGQTSTAAGEAAVLLNTTPIIVPLMSYFAIQERLGRARYAAAAVGMGGIVLMSGILDSSGGGSSAIGVSMMLLSAIATSAYIIVTKRLSSDIRPMEFYPPVFLYGTLFMFAYMLLFGSNYGAAWGSTAAIASVLYLSVACSILPFFLWYWGLQHLSATASSVVTLFEPVVAIVVSVAFIGEVFGIVQLAGTALIFVAILVISR